MQDASAIIVGSKERARGALRRFLKSTCGLGTVSEVSDGEGGREYLEQTRFDLVLLDREACRESNAGLVRRAASSNGRVPIVIVTLLTKLAAFVRQLDEPGADPDEEAAQLENAALGRFLTYARQRNELQLDSESDRETTPFRREELFRKMGRSNAVRELARSVETVGPTSYSVLVIGETGAGKELVARAVHRASSRNDGRFVAVDCGAVTDSLVESELFGHRRGAFTGADESRPGKFQMADGGTLFLDEIATMSPNLQGSLLRALEQNAFYPVGGSEEVSVDTRVIAASNRDVRTVESFREDLYFRLAEYVIRVPPLRARRSDIRHLARRFLREANRELPHDVFEFSVEAMRLLKTYDWPGNVRELRNVVRHAALEARKGTIRGEHLELQEGEQLLSAEIEPEVDADLSEEEGYSLKQLVQDHREKLERQIIREVMRETNGNMAETARKLNVDYKTIYNKVDEYGIGPEEY